MCAEDVTATLDLALSVSGLDHITVVHRPPDGVTVSAAFRARMVTNSTLATRELGK